MNHRTDASLIRPAVRIAPARLRRAAQLLAPAAALTLVLSGCGTTGTPEPAKEIVPASKIDGCANDTTETGTGAVKLTDSVGRTVELKEPAKRIVVIEWQQIEDALTLCVAPVAVADSAGYGTWDTAVALPKGIADVGSRQEPNLDAIFSANPDLVIVEANSADDEILKKLAKYDVPVLATKGADAKDPIGNMRKTFSLIAEATGREARATEVLGELDASIADAKTQIADAQLKNPEFVYFDGWMTAGNVTLRPFGKGSLIAELGEEIGLKNAWTGEVDPAYGLGQTDIEGMRAVGDANLFHTSTEQDAGGSFVNALTQNEVWKKLPAVAEDRVYAFPAGIWTFGGPRSSQQVVDAFANAVTGTNAG